ncbi:MAG: hypothetical protein K1X79_06625 [Oligoflexia bacterium]|nr:hypothetical protein [Oligoflexia bacterium]
MGTVVLGVDVAAGLVVEFGTVGSCFGVAVGAVVVGPGVAVLGTEVVVTGVGVFGTVVVVIGVAVFGTVVRLGVGCGEFNVGRGPVIPPIPPTGVGEDIPDVTFGTARVVTVGRTGGTETRAIGVTVGANVGCAMVGTAVGARRVGTGVGVELATRLARGHGAISSSSASIVMISADSAPAFEKSSSDIASPAPRPSKFVFLLTRKTPATMAITSTPVGHKRRNFSIFLRSQS